MSGILKNVSRFARSFLAIYCEKCDAWGDLKVSGKFTGNVQSWKVRLHCHFSALRAHLYLGNYEVGATNCFSIFTLTQSNLNKKVKW